MSAHDDSISDGDQKNELDQNSSTSEETSSSPEGENISTGEVVSTESPSDAEISVSPEEGTSESAPVAAASAEEASEPEVTDEASEPEAAVETSKPEGAEEPLTPSESKGSEKKEEVPAGHLSLFSDDELPKVLRSALTQKGFATLTMVQTSVVHADTAARDLRISSQTGSGKTVAIGLALGREILKAGLRREMEAEDGFDPRAPQVLLLTPTRELATQVQRELSWLLREVPDAWVEVVTGGTSVGLERKQLAKGPRIVVGTPGRVFDHLQRGGFKGDHIAHVVLDEADQMFDMGFRDELHGILELLPNRQRTHLVSATFSGEVQRIAEQYQENPVRLEGTALGKANEDIEHIAHVVGFRHRYDAVVNLLLKAHATREDDSSRTLIFTRTRADANEVAERLQRDGVKAEPLSGDLAQAQRTRTLSAFRSGRVSTLVATDVAARGLDVQGIDLVVHLDPPSDPDSFTHRSGRTGRAGRKGTSVLLMPPQARGRVERILRVARVNPTWAPVPTADKIKKLYSKLAKRAIYAALEQEVDPSHLEYATKLVEEQDPKEVIARLLALHEVEPPCPPRDITEHFSENRGRRGPGGGDRGGPQGRGRPGKWRADGPGDRGRGGRFGGGGDRDRDGGHQGGGRFRGPDGGGGGLCGLNSNDFILGKT